MIQRSNIALVALMAGVICMNSEPVSAQCPSISGYDIFSADEITVLNDLKYGEDIFSQKQKLDLYFPTETEACTSMPLVLVVHGGGFQGGDKKQLVHWGYHFAMKGSMVAVINYRLYMQTKAEWEEYLRGPINFFGSEQCQELNSIGLVDMIYKIDKAWYFAIQDANRALAAVQKMMRKANREISKVIALGESAGAISVLGMAMAQQEEFDEFEPLLKERFGPIHPMKDGEPMHLPPIDAVVSLSGGLINAPLFVSSDDQVPVLFFHGGSDPVVPLCDDGCDNMDRRMYGPLRLQDFADSLNMNTTWEIHAFAAFGHDLRKKYDEISPIIMGRLLIPKRVEVYDGLTLYPSSARLTDCSVVNLRNQIRDLSNYLEKANARPDSDVYPNPSNGIFHVNTKQQFGVSMDILVYDMRGHQVHQESRVNLFITEQEIDLSHLNSGIYQMVVIDRQGIREQFKVVIQRE